MSKQNIELHTGFSVLMFPFQVPDAFLESQTLLKTDSIWRHSSLKLKDNYLFDHVKSFFNKNGNTDTFNIEKLDWYQSLIFELKDQLSDSWFQSPINILFQKKLKLKVKEIEYEFRFFKGVKKSIFSPKVFILPKSRVGLLILSVELTENDSLERFIDFQYGCRTIYSNVKQSSKISFVNESTDFVEQKVLSRINTSCEKLHGTDFTTFHQLIEVLLKDFTEVIKPIHLDRFHIFSFVQTKHKIEESLLVEKMFQLSRVYNKNYNSPYDTIKESDHVIQMFGEIYCGVTPEGGCIFVNSDYEKSTFFIQNYSVNPVQSRYFWTYLLAFQQRCSLINTAQRVEHVLEIENVTIPELTDTIDVLARIQIKSMFQEISPISNHNLFYSVCRDQFNIVLMFQELKNELADLNIINQQKVELLKQKQAAQQQELLEKRNLIQKEESERHRKFESRFNFILILIGLLTFISVWKDFSDIIIDGFDKTELVSISILAVAILLLGLVTNEYRKRIK